MRKFFSNLFKIDKKPRRGLLPVEWVMMGYLVLTLLFMLFTYTKVPNPESILWGRFRVVVITVAMWSVYRLVPCRLTHLCRIAVQLALLSWWYPDTYELNRILPNLDYHVASLEQQLFGTQPALWLAQVWSHPVISELMHLGYASYYPMIVCVTLYFFICHYEHFNRTAFIILTSFFIYYVIFIALPVTGPQYYYLAAGLDNIAHGVFPDLGNYFATHQESLSIPGYQDGVFYHIVSGAHAAGERPTAAFPSSHVGVSTILLLIALSAKSRKLVLALLPFYVLMCFATVYIQAHYTIDVIGGWVSGVIIYFSLYFLYKKFLD